ncbi:MAG: ATP-binding protein [Bacillota bacterium]
MRDISLHLLDIAENAVAAGATAVDIEIVEEESEHLLRMSVKDNGRGMDPTELSHAMDPFYSTKEKRKIGLGLPFLQQACEMTGGELLIHSAIGRGTEVQAVFKTDHVDCLPLGDISSTVLVLVLANPEVHITYRHVRGRRTFSFDSRRSGGALGQHSYGTIRRSVCETHNDLE